MDAPDILNDRFELQAQIGAGGMATIYRALDRHTGAVVALKILHGRTGEQTERFGQEAEVLSELSHPAIVRYVAHGTTPVGEHFLAMEWLEGETLERRLELGPIGVAEAVELCRRVADGLISAHRRGIVHRDLKPSNLFLPDGRLDGVKLLDFGLARRVLDPKRYTQAGVLMGTPMYMAPEQARGEPNIDTRADLFALGCVLFECLTGRPPFSGATAMAVLAKICVDESLPLRALCPGLPQELEELLSRLLAKDRERRPADAVTVEGALADIGELLRGTGGEPSSTAGARRTRDALTAGEQRIICVVLAARPRPEDPAPRSGADADTAAAELAQPGRATLVIRTGGAGFASTDLDDLRRELVPYGARIERLLDGSIVLTLAGRGAATDQATHAARCALRVLERLPQATITISTGRAVLFGQLPVGQVIDHGAELLRTAEPGQIRLDDTTAGLLDGHFDVTGPVGARTLEGERPFDDAPRTLLGKTTACVGRDRELALLEGTFEDAIEEPVARAVLVTAPAGGGKSRVRYELVLRLRRKHAARFGLLLGRADALHAGAPFALLAPAVRDAVGILSQEPLELRQAKLVARVARSVPNQAAGRVSEFLGELLGTPFSDAQSPALRAARQDPRLMADQIRSAWLDWLAGECRSHPVLLVLDDVHWGDRPSLQLVEAALRTLRDQPLMVLAFARPEVDEQFPGLWEERDVQRLRLPGLTRRACQTLARQILGDRLDEATRDWLLDRSDGNPFYLEELIRAVASGERDALPETVLGMVQARLDALGGEAKRVLRAASIFGRTFCDEGVAALLGEHGRSGLAACLSGLFEREVIFAKTDPRAEHTFRHALLRDAAYAMLTDGDRSLGHLLAAEWLESCGGAPPMVLAGHFERGGDLARAARWCLAGAEQALEANDLVGAIAHAERGVACGAVGETLAGLRLAQAQAYFWRGEYAFAESTASAAGQAADRGSADWFRAVTELVGALGQLGRYADVARWAMMAGATPLAPGASAPQLTCLVRAAGYLLPGGRYDATDAILARVEAETGGFARLDAALATKVHAVRGARAIHRGDHGEGARLFEEAVRSAESTGDTRARCEMRANLASVWADLGQLDVAEHLLRQSLAEAEATELHYAMAYVLLALGPVLAQRGRLDDARRFALRALALARQQQDQRAEGAAQVYLSTIAHLAGNHADAEHRARLAGELVPGPLQPTALAALARAVLAQGRAEEAVRYARTANDLLASLGYVEEYESLVRLILAEALEASGDRAEAEVALSAALGRLASRARQIGNPAWRESFLALADNARTVALAERWGLRFPAF